MSNCCSSRRNSQRSLMQAFSKYHNLKLAMLSHIFYALFSVNKS
jgi:hypothetical protein